MWAKRNSFSISSWKAKISRLYPLAKAMKIYSPPLTMLLKCGELQFNGNFYQGSFKKNPYIIADSMLVTKQLNNHRGLRTI